MLNVLIDFSFMHILSFIFFELLNYLNIENIFLGNLGFNLTRSIVCGSLAYYSYKNLNKIYNDKCLLDNNLNNDLILYHRNFLNYFVYDIFVMIYQVYKKINNKIRFDLLFHHMLAIFVLNLLEYNKMYNLALLIGLSEGMSFVSGFKLISNKLNKTKIKKFFIYFRLSYLILIRMVFLWPSLILFYNEITNNCNKFKGNKNLTLVIGLLSIIVYNEIKWIQSGIKELKRI